MLVNKEKEKMSGQGTLSLLTCMAAIETDTIKYIGLSMAGQSTSPPTFTACSPGLAHECDGNSYLNSICQECTKKIVDLVFLIDGSGSMTGDEFDESKGFINNIMTTLKNSSIKFAAVQFSSTARTVFDFNDYQEGRALTNLTNEKHMAHLTNTYQAIDSVLKNIFENQAAGATADATKVLVLITDGTSSDSDRNYNSIKRSDEKNIIRFVIGVKNVDLKKLKFLASEPKENNTFLIQDYNGLKGILDNFQKKIFNIQETDTIKYIGLSMAGQSTSPPTFTACSPGLAHECDLNSICYQFNSQLQITSNFTPAFQECTKKIVDLVFLIDGSASMTGDAFEKNKGFINNIMTTLKNSSIKFAAVQFSSTARTVFDFNDYQEGRALTNLTNEKHMALLTNTHQAIDFVLKNIFENQAAGATADATKVLVVITDGKPSDTDRNVNSIKRSDEKNIIRFVIG
ncbi:unnamed protein product, partial [Coregonus sp. 'balchen']